MPGPDELKAGDRVRYSGHAYNNKGITTREFRGTVKKPPSGLKNVRVDWDDGTSQLQWAGVLEKLTVLDEIVEAIGHEEVSS